VLKAALLSGTQEGVKARDYRVFCSVPSAYSENTEKRLMIANTKCRWCKHTESGTSQFPSLTNPALNVQ